METLHLVIIAIGILSGISLVPAIADDSTWHVQHVIGKFLNSNPPKPDQVFNFQYRVVNGTLAELTKDQYGQFEAKVQATDKGMLELRIPRNYPYSNVGYPHYNNTVNVAGSATVIDVNGVGIDSKKYSFVSTDCFFDYSIPFIGTPTITLGFIVYPEGIPYAGDKVPDHCISETITIQSPLKQFKSGTRVQDIACKEGLQLVIKSKDKTPACVKPEHVNELIKRGWATHQTGVDALPYPPVQLINVATSPQPIILGIPFYVNVTIVNHQSVPITYYGGCVSPISITFDNIKTDTGGIHCLAISKNILGPNEQVVVHSEKIGTI